MPAETLPALTLIPPWAHAVAHWGKRVENRSWAPPRGLLGKQIAIHSGKSPWRQRKNGEWAINEGALEDVREAIRFCEKASAGEVPNPTTAKWIHERCSAVLCVATVAGWVHEDGYRALNRPERFASRTDTGPWFVGPYGWVLSDVVALPEPVPCSGKQGVWSLPADVDAAVRAQLGRRTE